MSHHHGFSSVLMFEGTATFSLVTVPGAERWQRVRAAALSAMIPEASQMDGIILQELVPRRDCEKSASLRANPDPGWLWPKLCAMCFPAELLIKAGVVLHQKKRVHKLLSLAMELPHSSLTRSKSAFLGCVRSIFWPTFLQFKDSAMQGCCSPWPERVIRHLSAWLTVQWQGYDLLNLTLTTVGVFVSLKWVNAGNWPFFTPSH